MAARKVAHKAKSSTAVTQRASVQTRYPAEAEQNPILPTSSGYYLWQTQTASNFGVPRYWSPQRDAWLRQFYTLPGNDLLAGTIATVISKVQTTGWFIEGPERMAGMYQRILARQVEFGAGWSVFISKLLVDYLTQDQGAWIERKRLDGPAVRPAIVHGPGDIEESRMVPSAADGFACFDAATITPKNDPEWPAYYLDDNGVYHSLHISLVGHMVDLPSSAHRMNNVGFCACSRALTTARILMLIAKYKQERLSDLPPAGLMILNNLNEDNWKDITDKYDMQQSNQGNMVWRRVMVAFGLDPALPAKAELTSFSSLPEHYDEAIATEIAVYSFALAFNIDPADLWPRRNTPLGTASEASISHLKAKGKRTGAIYSDLERFFNDGYSLPRSCSFRFDYQDADEDLMAADIRMKNVEAIRRMFEPPNVGGEGMISLRQAQQLLVINHCAPEFILQAGAAESVVSDVGAYKSHVVDLGPKSRVYRDGTVYRLERKPQAWTGHTTRQLTPEAIARAMTCQSR